MNDDIIEYILYNYISNFDYANLRLFLVCKSFIKLYNYKYSPISIKLKSNNYLNNYSNNIEFIEIVNQLNGFIYKLYKQTIKIYTNHIYLNKNIIISSKNKYLPLMIETNCYIIDKPMNKFQNDNLDIYHIVPFIKVWDQGYRFNDIQKKKIKLKYNYNEYYNYIIKLDKQINQNKFNNSMELSPNSKIEFISINNYYI